jgi:hypothetical protein
MMRLVLLAQHYLDGIACRLDSMFPRPLILRFRVNAQWQT